MLASLLFFVVPLNQVSVERLFVVPGFSSYSATVDPVTKNFAFSVEGGQTYLVDFKSKKARALGPGRIDAGQIDCGVGLVTVFNPDPEPKSDTYRLSDGKLVGSTAGFGKRVGRLFQSPGRVLDLNGKTIHRDPSMGGIIWDGKRRIAIKSRGTKSEEKDVVELLAGWKPGKKAFLSNNALSFDRIVGNPDTGSFAIYEKSNRTTQVTGIFTRDFKRIGGGSVGVTSISSYGILGSYLKSDIAGANLIFDGAFCLNSTTGTVLWKGKASGRWVGAKVVAHDLVIDRKTGKDVARIIYPDDLESVIATEGDIVIARVRGGGIGAYRILL